jgi:hypothetical protein
MFGVSVVRDLAAVVPGKGDGQSATAARAPSQSTLSPRRRLRARVASSANPKIVDNTTCTTTLGHAEPGS